MRETNLYDILNHRNRGFYCIARDTESASSIAREAGHVGSDTPYTCIRIDIQKFRAIDTAADSMNELLTSGRTGRVSKEVALRQNGQNGERNGDRWMFVNTLSPYTARFGHN